MMEVNLNVKYTMSFLEWRTLQKEWYENNIKFNGDDNKSNSIRNMINSVWDMYEISGETMGEFQLFLLSTFNEYQSYYKELLDNYEKKFEWDTKGLTRTTTSNRTGSSTDNSEGITVDLPNKVIDKADYFKYPSGADKGTANNSSTSDETRTVTMNDNFIFMKNQYMNQIKNLYREFALKFSDCFVHIF